MNITRIVRGLKDRLLFTGWRCDFRSWLRRLEVDHPSIPAKENIVGTCLAYFFQSLCGERGDPRVQPMRAQIECALHRGFETVDTQRFQVSQAGPKFTDLFQVRLSRSVRLTGR